MDRVIDNLSKQQDKQSQIVEGSKLLATYLGWIYVPHNDLQGYSKSGWWKPFTGKFRHDGLQSVVDKKSKDHKDKFGSTYYVCRSHHELRFFNSYDFLFDVIYKLEKEDLKDYFDEGNFMQVSVDRFDGKWDACVNLNLDPPYWLSSDEHKNLPDRGQLFEVLVAAVRKVNEIKNG